MYNFFAVLDAVTPQTHWNIGWWLEAVGEEQRQQATNICSRTTNIELQMYQILKKYCLLIGAGNLRDLLGYLRDLTVY